MASIRDLFKRTGHVFVIPLENLVIGDNVRTTKGLETESIAALANSLHLEGQRDNIKGYLSGTDFIVTSGQRRTTAARYANVHYGSDISSLRAEIEPKFEGKETTGAELILRQLTDGTTPEPIAAIDKAMAYKALVRDGGYTVKTLAGRLGKSNQHIRDMLKLLEAPKDIQEAVSKGAISPTAATKTARARKEAQKGVQDKIAAGENVSIRDVETDGGKLKPLLSVEISKLIKKADKNMYSVKGNKEKMRWQGVKYGLESALGMHEW